MTIVILIGLVIAVMVLWQRVEALRANVRALEYALHPSVVTAPAAVVIMREPEPEPEPEAEPEPLAVEERVVPQAAPPTPVFEMPAPIVAEAPDDWEEPFESSEAPSRGFNLEELFGRRLPIWAGGITLAIAGFLIVKYSIDAGLLSPALRIIFGLLFGAALIGGAEVVLRRTRLIPDPRVGQALSGAGVATLYGSVLAAANLYHLIGPGVAFAGLAAVTALAGALALRFGSPSALLGLVGGLAAPALVGAGEPNVPLLSAYLALTVGGLCTLGRARGWAWLGAAALIGGFGWGALLILNGALDAGAVASIGIYTLLIGIALPAALLAQDRDLPVKLGSALLGCAQMAALVATGGFSPLGWALFGLIAAAAVWLSRREPQLRLVASAAQAIALLLMVAWPDPTPAMLAIVLAGAVLIFAGPAAWELWRERGRPLHAAELASLSAAILLIPTIHGLPSERVASGLALLGAILSGGIAALGWRATDRRDDTRFAILAGTAGAMLAAAAVLFVPGWAAAPAVALVAGGLLLLAHAADDPRVEKIAWSYAGLMLVGLALEGFAGADAERALGLVHLQDAGRAFAWGVPAAVIALFAWRGRLAIFADAAQALVPVLAYVALAQVVPAFWLPLAAAGLLAATAFVRGAATARDAAALVSLGWAFVPLVTWGTAGLLALGGQPLLVTVLPTPIDAAMRLVPAALALLLAARMAGTRRQFLLAAGVIGGVALHIGFKQIFALGTDAQFVALGLAERTLWEALLAGAAILLRNRLPMTARALGLVALAHFAIFTLILHNPLWAAQDVGSLPGVSLLLPAYATALILLWMAQREPIGKVGEQARRWSMMAVIGVLALSFIRQLAHGTRLDIGVIGDAENIAYSLAGVGLALGFLVYGIRRAEQEWRLGSLLLMLAAVAKVFLSDAAGLDGLARVASFAGLGFSLIGVGWLYSRYLPEPSR